MNKIRRNLKSTLLNTLFENFLITSTLKQFSTIFYVNFIGMKFNMFTKNSLTNVW